MLTFYENFIGNIYSNITVPFKGTDDEQRYQENLISQPEDWYYRNICLTYSFNALGHRSKNIEDIKLDNYILTVGCSITEGIGLEIEKTYPYLVSQKLNCDYYNLGIGAAGPDAIMYNLLLWLSRIEQKPKVIILQWPNKLRYATRKADGENIETHGMWRESESYKRFMILGDEIGYFNFRKELQYNLIEEMTKNIKLVHIRELNSGSSMKDEVLFSRLDLARDLMHLGIQSHSKMCSDILEKLS